MSITPSPFVPESAARRVPAPFARFLALVLCFVAVELGLVLLGTGAIELIDATRSFATGESLYSKGRRSATLDLHIYAETADERAYEAFLADIAVPLGDGRARRALEAAPVDRAAAVAGLIAGRNAEDDIGAMILFFRLFRQWAPFATAVEDWRQGDALVDRLDHLAGELRESVGSGRADPAERQRLLQEIDAVDGELTRVEQSYLVHIGVASRTARRDLTRALGLISIVLLAAGVGYTFRTYRKALSAEAAAQSSERRFRDFAEAASDWFWETDGALRLCFLSERFAAATGLDPMALLGTGLAAPDPVDGDPETRDAIAAAVGARQPFRSVRRYHRTTAGAERCWLLSGVPVFGEGDVLLGYRGTGTDVTAEIGAQRAVELARAEAELASRSKSEFLAHISHEFRTPLNAILGFSELIRQQPFGSVGARYVGYAEDIHSSGHHLLSLVTDILDLSKIEAGGSELNEEHVDVATLFAGVFALMHERATANELVLDQAIEPTVRSLFADKRRLKQMLINLVGNAIKFTPPGGHVTVSAGLASTGEGRLSVTDTGIGIARRDIARVLAPFGQVENPMSRRHQGTGLGLTLTRAMAELHGGRLEIDSTEGQGTTVSILLPAGRIDRPVGEAGGGEAATPSALSLSPGPA